MNLIEAWKTAKEGDTISRGKYNIIKDVGTFYDVIVEMYSSFGYTTEPLLADDWLIKEAKVKKTGWINLYVVGSPDNQERSCGLVYPSQERAEEGRYQDPHYSYLTTVEITWEE